MPDKEKLKLIVLATTKGLDLRYRLGLKIERFDENEVAKLINPILNLNCAEFLDRNLIRKLLVFSMKEHGLAIRRVDSRKTIQFWLRKKYRIHKSEIYKGEKLSNKELTKRISNDIDTLLNVFSNFINDLMVISRKKKTPSSPKEKLQTIPIKKLKDCILSITQNLNTKHNLHLNLTFFKDKKKRVIIQPILELNCTKFFNERFLEDLIEYAMAKKDLPIKKPSSDFVIKESLRSLYIRNRDRIYGKITMPTDVLVKKISKDLENVIRVFSNYIEDVINLSKETKQTLMKKKLGEMGLIDPELFCPRCGALKITIKIKGKVIRLCRMCDEEKIRKIKPDLLVPYKKPPKRRYR